MSNSTNMYKILKKNDEWETPQYLFDELNEEFQFTIDVCAKDSKISKCKRFYSISDNGLLQDWTNEICWMNPPYSQTKLWMKKAHEECQKGSVIVSLTFAKTDTIWFHEYAYKHEIRFIKGRLSFGDYNKTKLNSNSIAPFGSMITIFKSK